MNRHIISLVMALALTLQVVSPSAYAAAPLSQAGMLGEAKRAYLDGVATQLDAAIDRTFADRDALRNLPPQGDLSSTLDLTMPGSEGGADSVIQAKYTLKYALDTALLRTITQADTVVSAAKKISGSAFLVVTMQGSMPTMDLHDAELAVHLEGYIKEGVVYFRLADVNTKNISESAFDAADMQDEMEKGWRKIDLLADLSEEEQHISLGDFEDAIEEIIVTDSTADSLTSLLNLLAQPGQTDSALAKSLMRVYLQEVWGASPIFTRARDESGTTLTFGQSDLVRLTNKHFDFFFNRYERILDVAKRTHPFDPALEQMPQTAAGSQLEVWRSEAIAALPEIPTFTVSAAFSPTQLAHLRLVRTWQEEASAYCGYDFDNDKEKVCPDVKQNYHTDIRYYLNNSLDPNKHSVHAIFASRRTDETLRSSLEAKAFPIKDGLATAKMVLEGYSYEHDYTVDAPTHRVGTKYTGALTLAADVATGRLTAADGSLEARNFGEGSSMSRLLGKVVFAATEQNRTLTASLRSTPAGVLSADSRMSANRLTMDSSTTFRTSLLGAPATATATTVYRGSDTQPVITLPAGALSATEYDEERDSRDDMRASDLVGISSGLGEYFSAHGSYPASTGVCLSEADGIGAQLIEGEFISYGSVFEDPFSDHTTTFGGVTCTGTHYYQSLSKGGKANMGYILIASVEEQAIGNVKTSSECAKPTTVEQAQTCATAAMSQLYAVVGDADQQILAQVDELINRAMWSSFLADDLAKAETLANDLIARGVYAAEAKERLEKIKEARESRIVVQ